MTSQEQRITIAEACGWLSIKNYSTIRVNGLWKGYPPKNAIINKPVELPDYLNDLNAMREALSTLRTNGSWEVYKNHLTEITKTEGQSEPIDWFIEHNATASQRAEAFLKTIGKWK